MIIAIEIGEYSGENYTVGMYIPVDDKAFERPIACHSAGSYRCGSTEFIRHHTWPERFAVGVSTFNGVGVEIIEMLIHAYGCLDIIPVYDFF